MKRTNNRKRSSQDARTPTLTDNGSGKRRKNPQTVSDDDDDEESVVLSELRAWTKGFPIYTDGTRSFYSEINIFPPYRDYKYLKIVTTEKGGWKGRTWKLKLGDTVIVHWESGTDESDSEQTHYPFRCPWGIAEIVTMWTTEESEVADLSEIMVEIRWFYRKHELTRTSKNKNLEIQQNPQNSCEEIFESDHTDEVSALSLLAPVNVHATAPKRSMAPKMQDGMPVLNYFCHRFWSINRNRFVPLDSLPIVPADKRIQRGWLHSSIVEKDHGLKRAMFAAMNRQMHAPSRRHLPPANYKEEEAKVNRTYSN
mmetsp:Transcript_32455/g.74581  ORF Transcript_32455/g.74581 Transcript_32455/m.74581 type:complete len:311 (-) Transcript_32455:270-1202(-)|eukprot:CAMPEP_0116851784 /NCGR_PEP_ID=MMETSP0418-20121206/16922_1 /TAXON_ID=1158023 /ORGANISM="Astrosyne radiata, Strain 13vi08-1A" /LENGTH=310 /DNA_ID=CAMNT_0004483859 /DNA_START=100 /DNA_END=1035 /DNA_ORIENTATION=-